MNGYELTVFIGADPRQPLSYTVCASSVLRHAGQRVRVEPLGLYDWTPGCTRHGLTSFTFARYLCPFICGFYGWSIFMDGDIIVRGSVAELLEIGLANPDAAVSVAQHVPPFERPSVMVFNNRLCKRLTKEYVEDPQSVPQSLAWAEEIGNLPPEWNHCVGYDNYREDAKLIHYTAGIPCWEETWNCPHAEKWREERDHAMATVGWSELLARSVHAKIVGTGQWRKSA